MNSLLADAAMAANHCPDSGIRERVRFAIQALEHLPRHIDTWQASLARNRTLADCLKIEPDHLTQSKLHACTLCDRGDFLLALPLAQLNEADAASAYRLGECLEATGLRDDARHLYQWAVDLARGNFALRRLQEMAGERLARLQIS